MEVSLISMRIFPSTFLYDDSMSCMSLSCTEMQRHDLINLFFWPVGTWAWTNAGGTLIFPAACLLPTGVLLDCFERLPDDVLRLIVCRAVQRAKGGGCPGIANAPSAQIALSRTRSSSSASAEISGSTPLISPSRPREIAAFHRLPGLSSASRRDNTPAGLHCLSYRIHLYRLSSYDGVSVHGLTIQPETVLRFRCR